MPNSKPRLLVIEDNENDRLLLESVLVRAGFALREFVRGEDAIEELERNPNRYCGIMLNLVLPGGLQGSSLIRRCKEIAPTIPIFVVTGLDDKDRRAEIYAAGAVVIYPKNFDDAGAASILSHMSLFHAVQTKAESAMKAGQFARLCGVFGFLTCIAAGTGRVFGNEEIWTWGVVIGPAAVALAMALGVDQKQFQLLSEFLRIAKK